VTCVLRPAAVLFALAVAQAGRADFTGLTWVDEPPELKGKVVLVRWWTNGCRLCSASAPVLGELAKKASIVAVYHPKPPREVSREEVRGFAKEIGMPGFLAIDRDWKVLDRWMPPEKRSFTSLTFLLDGKGRIRHVHPGGAIDAGEARELAQQIDALLAEK
jgi:thiol-disulfide isomerase/thioredoxin